MLKKLNPELVLGFLLASTFWTGIFLWQSHPAEHSKTESQSCEGTKSECAKATTDEKLADYTWWLAVLTGALVTVSAGQGYFLLRADKTARISAEAAKATAIKTAEMANIAREAMVSGERAFVFATGINPYWEVDKSGLYHWRFRPNWKNSGDTPTKHMTMHSECVLRTTPLPIGFEFNYPTTDIGAALIAPNTESGGGIAPRFPAAAISPQDILDVQAGLKILYFFGWAKYFDVFPDTPQHITRFCWQIVILGDPLAYDPGVSPQNLTFPNVYHHEGNCADDECAI
jgi:hypothetical protein